jgi:SOS-response transcriptional repressor LexA
MSFAAPANDELADTVTIGEFLLRDKDASYLLQMQGDALVEEGILDGDYIIFERSNDYKPGHLVVELASDGYHVKRLARGTNIVEVVGIVTGTFRKYF